MKAVIVRPYVAIWTPEEEFNTSRKIIERAARLSHDSNDKFGTNENFIHNVGVKRDHKSIFDHRIANFKFRMTRPAANQLVRTRIGSYTQKSQRYIGIVEGQLIDFICPPEITALGQNEIDVWLEKKQQCLKDYKYWRERGVRKETARGELKNDIATEIATTFNITMWRHVIANRALNSGAQWEIRGIFQCVLFVMHFYMPRLFQDQLDIMMNMPEKYKEYNKVDVYREDLDNGELENYNFIKF